MSLTAKEVAELKKIVARANELIAKANGKAASATKSSARRSSSVRNRRSGKELESFKKMLKAERRRAFPLLRLPRNTELRPPISIKWAKPLALSALNSFL
jgi:hypothetical protein